MSSNSPCAACKCLRRKCTQECVFAPYFPPDNPQKFTNVHKVFGASNVSKLLNTLDASERQDAVNSLVYEAEHRLRDPIYGCVGFIAILQQELTQVNVNLENAKKELATYIGPSAMMPMLNHPEFVLQQGPSASAYQVMPQNVQPMMGMQLGIWEHAPPQQQQQLVIRERAPPQQQQQLVIREPAPLQQQQQLVIREPAPPQEQQQLVIREQVPPQQQQQFLKAQHLAAMAAAAARQQEMMKQQHQRTNHDLMRFNSEGGGAVTATGLNQIGSGSGGGGAMQQPSLTLGSSYEASHQQFQHQRTNHDLMRFNNEGDGAVTAATGLNQIGSGSGSGGAMQQPSLTLGSSYEASHQQFQQQEQEQEHEYEHGQLHPLHLRQLQQLQEYIEARQEHERQMQKGKGKADPCIGPSC